MACGRHGGIGYGTGLCGLYVDGDCWKNRNICNKRANKDMISKRPIHYPRKHDSLPLMKHQKLSKNKFVWAVTPSQ